jgi:TRAP transporter 4TM/12TM fusion protein
LRQLTGPVGHAVALWAVLAALFHIYTSGFGFLEPREQRSVHLGFLLAIAFVLYPAGPRSPQHRPSWLDWLCAALAVAVNVYSYLEANRINLRQENIDELLWGELICGTIATALIIEALRRAVTPVLAGLVAIGIFYLFVAHLMPGILSYHRQLPFGEIVETMYLLNGMGIYGSITGISATMVAIFIAFGAFIEKSGVGRLFHNLGTKIAGRYAGGPAKVEVFSSALFGTISGSSTANVFATGSFTIPAMIQLGYRRHFAGGVEAASSVGGQIMPPVMGAGAFVLAEITNTPYSDVIVAATIGAIAYFVMILVCVHFEAKRLGLHGVDPSEIPLWRVVLADLHLFLPVVLLMWLLFSDYSPHYAAFWSILAVPVCSWLPRITKLLGIKWLIDRAVDGLAYLDRKLDAISSNTAGSDWKQFFVPFVRGFIQGSGLRLLPYVSSWCDYDTGIRPRGLYDMLATGGRNMAIVALACAGAGMFVASLTVTGVVTSLATKITALAGSNLLLAGGLLMVVTLILGMGVPTTAAYIIGASIGAPILIQLGVPMLAAHLFIFYFSILADATPPVSVASYAAASIAKANPMSVGLVAFRLAIAGFVCGFGYLYTPALMMQGPVHEILAQVAVYLIGLTVMAAGMFGYFRAHLPASVRLVIVPAALVLVLGHDYDVWLRIALELGLVAILWALPALGVRRAPAGG